MKSTLRIEITIEYEMRNNTDYLATAHATKELCLQLINRGIDPVDTSISVGATGGNGNNIIYGHVSAHVDLVLGGV